MDGTLVPTNAFVLLTDNTFPFAKIQCALFKGTERVVFIDKRDFDGPLYGGLTIEQIKEGGSKIRNRCIAEVFSRMKIIESWGTGIKRMFSPCKEYGVREPELLEIGDSFRVNLYRPSYHEVHQSSPKNSPKSSPKAVNQT